MNARRPDRAAAAAAAALSAILALAGCGSAPRPLDTALTGTADTTETVATAPGLGLNLPKTLDGFTRVDTEDRHHGADIVAGYARTLDPSPVMATIRLHRLESHALEPLFDTGGTDTTGARSNAALDASIAQVRHYYPSATLGPRRDVYLLRFGTIQTGRSTTVTFDDLMDGRRQPIRLEIDTFCCQAGHWDYEYRFRSPRTLDAHAAISRFLQDIPWSADPAGSVDAPNL